VVQAIPTYSNALFKLPKGLCDHITSMVRKFWWGSKNGERKLAWVAWDDMTMPKYRGGLGSRDIEIFNLALLARQVWKILNEPGSCSYSEICQLSILGHTLSKVGFSTVSDLVLVM
jgi:hypothetical protein